MRDLLSPRARRLLDVLTPEPLPVRANEEGMMAMQELVKFGLAEWGPAGLRLTREGIRFGARHEMRN